MDLTNDSSVVRIAAGNPFLAQVSQAMFTARDEIASRWPVIKQMLDKGFSHVTPPEDEGDAGGFSIDIPRAGGDNSEYLADARQVNAIIKKALDGVGVEYIREQFTRHHVGYTVFGHPKAQSGG